jgi:hypothetical protein
MLTGDRLALGLGYGAVFVATALWTGHCFWLRDRGRVALAARGSSVLAAALLIVGLALYGLRVGYWPFHTVYELSTVGLLGLVLTYLTLLPPRRDGLLLFVLSSLSSLLAVYGLLIGGGTETATLVYDNGWWAAYVTLSAFGGGALVVASVTAVAACGRENERPAREEIVARRALAWAVLALSAGLVTGMWWSHRLSGRYWGDVRWAGVVVVWLVTMAAWHGCEEWLGRGWRSVLAGVALGLAGGYVLLGVGGVG